ncbi:MAG: hypothetical protein AUJ54_06630 [Ignavibacteria bacterium CG1_02_37_35]|nr:MAG: hypothetical protein AUJ54_06630 [Ignavibacteria bacterium CG1_02_37_35]
MATPKFDRISVEFSRRINDPVAAADNAGKVLSADERTAYVNKALFKYQHDIWMQLGGDVKKFIQVFPELVVIRTVLIGASARYTIANPNLDFFALVSGKLATSGKYVNAAPKEKYQIFTSGFNPTFAPSTDYPQMVELSGTIYMFPTSIVSTNLEIAFISLPVNPTDGAFLTQAGAYDSPFYDLHNSAIVDIAEELYRIDTAQSA